MLRGPPALCSFLIILAPTLSHADVYSFVDLNGVSHYSNVPVDSRYALLLSSDEPAPAGVSAKRAADWLSRTSQYDAIIRNAARAATLQPALVSAVIVVESGFNPRAVSKKGAIGLMQLLPKTARRYGVTDIYDPEQNIRAGAHYLSDLIARFGSNELALAAYNAGEEAVEHYGRRIPPYPETQSYVPSVMRVYLKLKSQLRPT